MLHSSALLSGKKKLPADAKPNRCFTLRQHDAPSCDVGENLNLGRIRATHTSHLLIISLFLHLLPYLRQPHRLMQTFHNPFPLRGRKKQNKNKNKLFAQFVHPLPPSPHLSSRCREIPDVSRGLGSQLTEVFPGPAALFVFSSHVAEPCLSGRQKVPQLSPFALNLYSGGLAGMGGVGGGACPRLLLVFGSSGGSFFFSFFFFNARGWKQAMAESPRRLFMESS